jgi:flagellar protein FliO/FliZ
LKDQGNRKRLLWIAVIGGVFLLALAFISLFAPSSAPSSPVIRPESTASQSAVDATPQASANAQSAGGGFSLGGGQLVSLAWRLALVVIIIAVSIVGLRWWGKRTAGPRSTTGFVRVIDTLAIGTGRTIHLVAMGDRVIAVGATAQQLTFLNELNEEEAAGILRRTAEAADQPLANFASELFQSMRQGGRLSIRSIAANTRTGQVQ